MQSLFSSFVMFLLLIVTGCETQFDPLKKSDEVVYSMFGTLDLHADTQWVRVMPVGETLLPNSSDAGRAEVTLVRMETGETITLEDSIFAFRNNTYVRNYWTHTPLHPEEDYLLQAEAADGRTSRARVSIPSPIPRPLTDYNTLQEEGLVIIPSDDSLVVAESKFVVLRVPGDILEITSSHLDHLFLTDEGTQRFRVEGKDLIENELGDADYSVLEREVIIAAGSPEWPDLSDLSEEEIPIPDTAISNVENGTGLVVGVASRKVPLKTCYNEDDELIPCEQENEK